MTALRIGTRRSDLALAQAGQVRLLLQAKGIDAQLVPMTTAGDEGQPVDVTTSPAGLKGMFIDTMVPAPGQGCLVVQCRAADRKLRAALTLLEHHTSGVALETERALVRRLGGNCDLPLGAIAAVRGDRVRLAAIVASPDGSELLRAAADASLPERAATLVADALLGQGADRILASVQGA